MQIITMQIMEVYDIRMIFSCLLNKALRCPFRIETMLIRNAATDAMQIYVKIGANPNAFYIIRRVTTAIGNQAIVTTLS